MNGASFGRDPRPLRAVVVVAIIMLARAAQAFPPYRSTDAEVASPGLLETRLGLARLERDDGENDTISPLLRVNLGIARGLELVSELEYLPAPNRLGDGALGLKWASATEPVSIGVETLALLPVSSEHSGAGVESQLVATLRRARLRLHANAGGFYDGRPSDPESGWRASLLGEWEKGRARLGAEIFAKQIHGRGVRAQAGPGIILSLDRVDVRASLHAGLSAEAPDLTASLWVSTEWELW
ncbi:MAG TPA: hypothetical protein VFR32_01265 [Gaiellaceae bacterium]|nr:hypothetical protein [Gaiellaceae bacterium]